MDELLNYNNNDLRQSESNLEIDIIRFASYRKKEIELLHSESFLSKEVKHKSLFQLLPRHMRRRTMGYLRKRLPHRIRKAAIIKPPSKVSKRPSRKYRRRPSNLKKEYERRKRAANMWLETHIWHAKRFHMGESVYGYRLPLFDNVKCKRAVYKCLKKHCCIHDESYYVCHQLEGSESDLLNGLSRLCSQQTGLTFGAKMYLDGQYEGKTVLYEENKYPFNCIGPVRFLWKSIDKNENSNHESRFLWIWSHPSIHNFVEEQLKNVFDLNEKNEEEPHAGSSPAIKKRKLKNKIILSSLKDKLIRFKLLGPLSTTILANILKTCDIFNENHNKFMIDAYKKQSEIWNKIKYSIKNPSQITSSTVVGLLVKDPRLSMPKKKQFNRVKEQNEELNSYSKMKHVLELNSELRKLNLSKSDIWNQNYIKELNKSKKKTHQINKMRSEILIPGTELTSIENHSKVPILLIQNNSHDNISSIYNQNTNDLYSGWDLIVPNTWGMDFWMTLIHFGARAIAQYENNYLLFESGHLQFPNEYFDTKSGETENQKLKLELFEKFSRRPPSKRVNYFSQAFLTPFYLPFKTLINLNQNINIKNDLNDVEFFILRNKQLLNKLSNLFFNKNKQIKFNNDLKVLFNMSEEEVNTIIDKSYICIRLKSICKGTMDKFSLLYSSDQNNQDEELKSSKMIINKLINNYRHEILENLKQIEKEKNSSKNNENIPKLNKLLRASFNKNAILIDETKYNEYELDLVDSSNHKQPIGFIYSNGFSLVDGKCTANGYILTKYIIDSIKNVNNRKYDSTLINYNIPSQTKLFRKSKIINFFSY